MNKDKPISQLPLATSLSGEEILPFAKSGENGSMLMSLIAEFVRQNMQKQLTAGEGIEITSENVIKTTLDVKPFIVVQTLPTENILNKIYLVPDPDGAEGSNEFIEYLWIEDHWEEVGKFKAEIDLSPYETTEHAEQTYATKGELQTLATLVNQLKTKLDTLPSGPASDGKIYAIQSGTWVEIAGATEVVATVNAETEETEETPST